MKDNDDDDDDIDNDDDDNDNDDDDFFDLNPLNTSKRALNTNPPFFGTPCTSTVNRLLYRKECRSSVWVLRRFHQETYFYISTFHLAEYLVWPFVGLIMNQ